MRNNRLRVRFPALWFPAETAHARDMKTVTCSLAFLLCTKLLPAEPSPAALAAFDTYVKNVDARLAAQHHTPGSFLAPVSASDADRLRQGQLIVERLTPSTTAEFPGALLHHWRGTAFAPDAHAADFARLLRDFASYPQYFAPDVIAAKVLTQDGDRIQASLRVRQKHVITVVMDTTYDVVFGRLDSRHGYSTSRSTRIEEIDSPGTTAERPLSASEEHGFLWRLNTWWTWEERDGGLYLQIEAVSLTRSLPALLGWAIRPYIESIPRESLEFTLSSARNALRQ